MNDFKPTFTVRDTAWNVRMFVKAYMQDLRMLMGSVLPCLVVLVSVQLYINYLMNLDMLEYFKELSPEDILNNFSGFMSGLVDRAHGSPLLWLSLIFQIGIGYCFAVIAVSWHRLVLLGKDAYEPMSFWKPRKHELDFIISWTILGTIIPWMIPYLMITNMGLLALYVLLFPYLVFKISFYFPAKALNANVSFLQSFRLTKGYFWVFSFALIRACIRAGLLYFLLVMVIGMIVGGVMADAYSEETDPFVRDYYTQIWTQPIQNILLYFFFQPLFTVLGVTVLSNYYQHALQNKQLADRT